MILRYVWGALSLTPAWKYSWIKDVWFCLASPHLQPLRMSWSWVQGVWACFGGSTAVEMLQGRCLWVSVYENDVRVRPRGRSSRTAKASWNAHSTPLPQRRLQRRCSGAWRAHADQPVNLRQHSSSCLSVSAGLWEFFSASVTTSSAHPTWH